MFNQVQVLTTTNCLLVFVWLTCDVLGVLSDFSKFFEFHFVTACLQVTLKHCLLLSLCKCFCTCYIAHFVITFVQFYQFFPVIHIICLRQVSMTKSMLWHFFIHNLTHILLYPHIYGTVDTVSHPRIYSYRSSSVPSYEV